MAKPSFPSAQVGGELMDEDDRVALAAVISTEFAESGWTAPRADFTEHRGPRDRTPVRPPE